VPTFVGYKNKEQIFNVSEYQPEEKMNELLKNFS